MPLWTANTTVKFPTYLNRQEKRNVIMTDIGYVRRLNKGTRRIDELLVDITGLATKAGAPKIHDIHFSRVTANVSDPITVNVVFTHPVKFNAGSGDIKLTVTNEKVGATTPSVTATVVANASNIRVANNTLAFTFTPTETGTFTVLGQTAANVNATAINFTSATSSNTAASLVISPSVSGAITKLVV